MRLKSSVKLFSAIVLISTLSLMTGVPLLHTASASPVGQERPDDRAVPLPKKVADAVLQDVARRSRIPLSSLRVVQAEPRTWSDGCLGLPEPGQFCTQALVPGWQISVQSKTKQWIYRSNQTGSTVKLARQTKLNNSRPFEDQPSATQVLFQSTASGGFAGQTAETMLLASGRVLHYRINPDGTKTIVRSWQVSDTQLQEFRSILAQEGFERFDRQDYTATPGSADFISVTLSSPVGTVHYADSVQARLPRSLQTIITAWNNLTRFS